MGTHYIPIVFKTVDDLKNQSGILKPGMIVSTTGYLQIDDGCGSIYKIIKTSDAPTFTDINGNEYYDNCNFIKLNDLVTAQFLELNQKNTLNNPISTVLDNYEYRVVETTNICGDEIPAIEIIKYTGNETEVTIPNFINYLYIVKIGDSAFKDCKKITKIILPEYLKEIGEYAFSGCRNLLEISIPDTVETIGKYSFQYCDKLNYMKLPFSGKERSQIIDTDEASHLFGYIFGEKPENYSDYNCSAVDQFIGEDISINVNFIKGSTETLSIKKVNMKNVYSSSVSEISIKRPFKVIINDKEKLISEFYNLKESDSTLTNYTFKFKYKKVTKEVDGVESEVLSQSGFYTVDDNYDTTSTQVSKNKIYNINGNTVYDSVLNTYGITVQWTDEPVDNSKLEITVTENVETQTKEYFIPNSLKTIELTPNGIYSPYAFSNCPNIEKVIIPNSSKIILSDRIFYNSNLSIISVFNNFKYKTFAFENCKNLSKIIINDSVNDTSADMEDYIYLLLKNKTKSELTEIRDEGNLYTKVENENGYIQVSSSDTIDSSETYYKKYREYQLTPWYLNSYKNINVIINDGITNIGMFMFAESDSIETVSLPETIDLIDNYAFYKCNNLKKITLSDHITTIGLYAFSSCNSLESIFSNFMPKNIYAGAFCNNTSLISVTFVDDSSNINYNLDPSSDPTLLSPFKNCSDQLIFYSYNTNGILSQICSTDSVDTSINGKNYKIKKYIDDKTLYLTDHDRLYYLLTFLSNWDGTNIDSLHTLISAINKNNISNGLLEIIYKNNNDNTDVSFDDIF